MVRHVTTPTSVPAWQGSGDKYTRYPYFRDSMGSASQTITQAQYTAGTESPVWWGQVLYQQDRRYGLAVKLQLQYFWIS